MLVISLQFNGSLIQNIYKQFSLNQLFENVFIPEVYATWGGDDQIYEMHIIVCSCGNGTYSTGFTCKFPGNECYYYPYYCFC